MNPDRSESDTLQTGAPLSRPGPVESETRSLPAGAIPTAFLFQGTQEILIDHNGEPSRLRITTKGKRILTK